MFVQTRMRAIDSLSEQLMVAQRINANNLIQVDRISFQNTNFQEFKVS